MRTITVANQKGGVGKTNVAMFVADAFQRRGARVLVVDTDKQKSAHKWEAKVNRKFPPIPVRVEAVEGLDEYEFAEWLKKRVDNLDYLIIDTPPNLDSKELSASLFISDIVVVPFHPHSTCVDALEEFLPLVNSIGERRQVPLNPKLLINLYDSRRGSEKAIVEHIETISPWPVLKTRLKNLSHYADAYNYRTSLFDLPGASEARKAILALIKELE